MKIPDVLQRKKNDDGGEESRPEPADSASTPTIDPVSTELADATRIILRSASTAKEGPNTVETIVDAPYLDEKKISSYMREKYPVGFWSAKHILGVWYLKCPEKLEKKEIARMKLDD